MTRSYAFAIALSMLVATPALAQHTTSADDKIVGRWEGSYTSDHAPPGGFNMIVTKDTALKATIDMTAGDKPLPTRVTEFKVAGNDVTWTQELMGMSCKATAVLAADTLRGETSCQHGAVSFVLRRK